MVYSEFFEKLNIKEPDRIFEPIFKKCLEEYEDNGVFFLENEYINYINSMCRCIERQFVSIVQAAQCVKKNKYLSVYALFVYRAMLDRENFMKHLKEFEFPQKEGIEYDFIAFLILLPTIEKLYDDLKKRGVDGEILKNTLLQYEECIYVYSERFDKFGLDKRYFDHLQGYVDGKFFNIGRLRFEILESCKCDVMVLKNEKNELAVLFDGVDINEMGMLYGTPPQIGGKFCAKVLESDEFFEGYAANENGFCEKEISRFYKSEWKKVFRKGDSLISIHIPGKGAFDMESIQKSVEAARGFFAKYYPKVDYKAFHCHSWMLDAQLNNILKPTSNLLAFQKMFKLYVGESRGEDVLNFVFKLKFKTFEDMPEDSSLQSGIKQMYLNGEYIYEFDGVFL